MLALETVLAAIEDGGEHHKRDANRMLDSRDLIRLAEYVAADQLVRLGFTLKVGEPWPDPKPWNEETVLAHFYEDLAFAEEKAADGRGLSAGLMYEVVKMWMWVLEDPLYKEADDYDPYGRPFLAAVRAKYPDAVAS